MQGVYIVIGDPVRNGTATYSTNMFLVSLPGLDPDGDIYIYDVEVSAKLSTTPDEPVSRRVVKVWDGEPTTGQVVRPTSIDVRLMRNGLAYETVTLNADNNWRYQWDELDPAARWTVTEVAVPANYRMTVTAEGVSFQMINTYIPPEAPPTVPPTTPPDNPPTYNPPTETPPTTTTPPTETPTVQGVKRVPVETPETSRRHGNPVTPSKFSRTEQSATSQPLTAGPPAPLSHRPTQLLLPQARHGKLCWERLQPRTEAPLPAPMTVRTAPLPGLAPTIT